MLEQSPDIADLATALAKAQAKIKAAHKDAVNPHFKSRYADLASVWEACRQPLTENGLSIVQALGDGDGGRMKCTTILLHTSGQYIRSSFSMTPAQNTPQAAGSCATYMRRYSLQSVVGVAPDDDDGNEASYPKPQARTSEVAATGKAVASREEQATKAMVAPQEKAPDVHAGPSASTFSKSNTEHVKKLLGFLEEKKQGKCLVAMCRMLEGKPYTTKSVNEAWDQVNPERPDKEPE